MNRTRTSAFAALLVAALGVAGTATGCSQSPEYGTASPEVKDFCDPLLEFFTTGFVINGVQLFYGGDLEEPVKDLTSSALCTYSAEVTNPVRAASWLTPVRDGERLTDTAGQLQDKGYVRLPSHDVDVWMRDGRVKGPQETNGVLDLATEVGNWQGSLKITNELDSLTITDEQVSQAADLLIRVTRDMGE